MTAPELDPEARWQQLRARMDATAAQRHIARRTAEAALSDTQFAALMERLTTQAGTLRVTEVAPGSSVTESAPVAPVQPQVALHELSAEEFRTHAAGYWQGITDEQDARRPAPPMTVSQYLAAGE